MSLSSMDTAKTAVVTGASAGIGAATARALAAAGFHVVLGARRLERLREVAAPLGERATLLPLDVTDPASVAAFAARLPERLQRLVDNAGGAHGLARLESAKEQRWERRWKTNVRG